MVYGPAVSLYFFFFNVARATDTGYGYRYRKIINNIFLPVLESIDLKQRKLSKIYIYVSESWGKSSRNFLDISRRGNRNYSPRSWDFSHCDFFVKYKVYVNWKTSMRHLKDGIREVALNAYSNVKLIRSCKCSCVGHLADFVFH